MASKTGLGPKSGVREEALLERETELALLAELLDGASDGRGGVLLVEGPAGIGKTALLGAARTLGADRRFAVLAARAGELERDFPFALARQLFEPFLREWGWDPGALPEGAARLAAAPLGLAGAEPVDEEFAAVNGLYWLTVEVAARGPLLICCDDAHWADGASLRWLGYLARHIDDHPLLLVLASRVGEEGASMTPFRATPETRVLRLEGLGEGGCAGLLASALARAPDDRFVRACQAATGGNPLLVRELAGELQDAASRPAPRRSPLSASSPRHAWRTGYARASMRSLSRPRRWRRRLRCCGRRPCRVTLRALPASMERRRPMRWTHSPAPS